ncbi:crossover junction endodeoxyribonuclease RuvC [Jonquetella anthropi]|uniref:crossover junction endodeoxyribonuclease RuvC n=1 Tax=Jonquetella anthropi TaxID=428712 RepID=UPI00058679D4|nr:crossover junction endodeoxyribonuclease RuvC [Jonquetella anthropi]
MRRSDPLCCLGVDPGIGRMGYGAVVQRGGELRAESCGCIETKPDRTLPERLKILYDQLREQIERCSPHFMAVERLYFGHNRTTAEAVWQARGVVLLLAAQFGLDVVEPKPSEAKLTVCGDGNAEKRQVQEMVRILLGLKEIPRPDDAADALAISMAGLALYGRKLMSKRG